MTRDCNVLAALQKLAKVSKDSLSADATVKDILSRSYNATKPLFASCSEKSQAKELFKKAIPSFESALSKFHGSLNLDLRRTAQRFRSGLQFLADELDERAILHCSAVKCIEEYIENSQGLEPDFPTATDHVPEDLSSIPSSHFWWRDDQED